MAFMAPKRMARAGMFGLAGMALAGKKKSPKPMDEQMPGRPSLVTQRDRSMMY